MPKKNSKSKSDRSKSRGSGPPTGGFVSKYFDKRTGRWMIAEDYGFKAWPFGGRTKP